MVPPGTPPRQTLLNAKNINLYLVPNFSEEDENELNLLRLYSTPFTTHFPISPYDKGNGLGSCSLRYGKKIILHNLPIRLQTRCPLPLGFLKMILKAGDGVNFWLRLQVAPPIWHRNVRTHPHTHIHAPRHCIHTLSIQF